MRFTKMHGVGNDFIVVDPGEVEDADLRCLARYARDFEIVEGDSLTVETGAGTKKVVLYGDGSSRVDMGAPRFDSEVELHGFTFLRVSMGNPHAFAFLATEEDVGALDLRAVGPPIENDPLFPERTNVEFAHARGR